MTLADGRLVMDTSQFNAAGDFVVFDKACFTYDGASYVFDELNLRVPEGQFLCLLGGNGSGKSTLAKCINAMLVPDKGQVLTFGRNTADADSLYFIRSNAGLVFQNPDDQLVASLVENDVAFGPENLGVPLPELADRVRQALSDVSLEGFQKKETSALSGGQKQRVAIAGILAMDPAILILDEASAMLDPRGRADLMRICEDLHEQGMTVIMITHYMSEAARAQRVVVLDAGKICMDGTPDEVLVRADELRHLSLDVPFAASLSLELRSIGIDVAPCVDSDELVGQLSSLVDSFDLEDASVAEICNPALDREPQDTVSENTDPEILITFEDVSFSYEGKEERKRRSKKRRVEESASVPSWALRNISFSVAEGEFLGIAGHTGSGKSTLIQHMNGLLHPTVGVVSYRGQNMADKKSAASARTAVGLVFQYPEYQLFASTVFDDVAFGPRNQGLSAEEIELRVRKALADVGLDVNAVGTKSPFELSGGQQRRVAFAGILAMEPDVLVLDEPVAGLDPAAREDFLDLIGSLHKGGRTCVMVSHSMDDLARMADRILVLSEGALYKEGVPSEVFADAELLHAVGLDVPEPQAVALKLQSAGWPLSRPFYTRAALVSDISRVVERSRGARSEEERIHE